jgi:ABC-type transporter Mla MlaB component
VLRYREGDAPDGELLVELEGDLAYGPWTERLRGFVSRCLAANPAGLVRFDLSAMGAIDLEGVATLLWIARTLMADGTAFRIERPPETVRAKLHQTGVLAYLEGGGR